jgi:hypothetical protein
VVPSPAAIDAKGLAVAPDGDRVALLYLDA